ncbi:MAG: S9 family peptidase [Proteobacteria bacterium]|nr:S9 family peptidase [Pseudomonadota bacterium]
MNPPPPPPVAQPSPPPPEDPYQYMEDADSSRALDWARAQNARTFGVLKSDPRYAKLYDDALAIVTNKDRIPALSFAGPGQMRNFWQDATHVRGIWRQTTLKGYTHKPPQWTTVLDIDALATADNANWVWHGALCLEPAMTRCLLQLSNGGKDAVTVREFDAAKRKFVDGGFVSDESKQDIDWYDEDHVYIGRDWGPGTLTESGYPYIVKLWSRGQPLASAQEVFRGSPKDVAASAAVLRDAQGDPVGVIIDQAPSFFEHKYFLLMADGAKPLPFPLRSVVKGLVDNQLVLELREEFPAQGMHEGDLVSFDLSALKANPATAKATLVLRPAQNEAADHVAVTRDRLVVALYEDVKGRLVSYRHARGKWSRIDIALPKGGSVDIQSVSAHDNSVIATTRSFLTPTQQWHVDAASGKTWRLATLPAMFDASRDVVEQRWATSSDGTRIPYFIVRPKNLALDGNAPTLLYAYGGFQQAMTPWYSGVMGKLWLERGGVLVVANIRGGGEFGPRWHRAGLKEHRQLVFDDFYAVARDLVATKVTSPRRLGIMGGSNGGLLMGVAMTQQPDLFNAVVIQVPLLDMLRYTKIGAGASWVGEYGDPAIPAERAYIEKYSPYQALKPGVKYPEPFFETSTKDDRVHPAHARKMAARMEALGDPFLYYENIDGGHAADANLNETALRSALEYTYLTQKLMD